MREGYKKTEIGVIPVEWEVVKIVEVLDLMTDYVANGSFASLRKNTTVYDKKEYAYYVRLFDLRRGLGHQAQKYVDEKTYNFLGKSFLEGNEILIANIGANVGESFLMPTLNMPSTLAPNMIELKLSYEKMIPLFCFNYLKSDIGLSELHKVTEGSGQPKINKTKLKKIKIPLPPLKEQQKIANILSTADKKIEAIDLQIQKAQMLKKGLLQKLLSDESWEKIKLEDISDFITKGSTPTTYGFDWQEKGILFLRSECVSKNGLKLEPAKFISKEAHAHLARSEIKANDILITITGNVGRVILLDDSFVTANINQHIARIRINDKTIDTKFILHFLSQQKVRLNYLKITTGQAYPQISLKQVRETFIPKISLKEQKQIAQILSTADEKLELLRAKKEKYETLKKGLLQKLLSGEIRVGCCP